jgi:hypothetical protein
MGYQRAPTTTAVPGLAGALAGWTALPSGAAPTVPGLYYGRTDPTQNYDTGAKYPGLANAPFPGGLTPGLPMTGDPTGQTGTPRGAPPTVAPGLASSLLGAATLGGIAPSSPPGPTSLRDAWLAANPQGSAIVPLAANLGPGGASLAMYYTGLRTPAGSTPLTYATDTAQGQAPAGQWLQEQQANRTGRLMAAYQSGAAFDPYAEREAAMRMASVRAGQMQDPRNEWIAFARQLGDPAAGAAPRTAAPAATTFVNPMQRAIQSGARTVAAPQAATLRPGMTQQVMTHPAILNALLNPSFRWP